MQAETRSIPEKIKIATLPLDNTILKLKKDLDIHKDQNKQKEVLIRSLSKDVELKNKKLATTNNKIDNLQSNLTELKLNLQVAENKIPEIIKKSKLPLLNKIASLQDTLNKYDSENAIKSKLINDISVEKASLSKNIKSLINKNNNFKKEINDLSNKIQLMMSAEPQKILNIKAPLERIIDELKLELKEKDLLIQEKLTVIDELAKNKNITSGELLKTKTNMREMALTVDELKTRIASLIKKGPINIKAVTKPLLAKIKILQGDLDSINKSIKEKDNKINELSNKNNNLIRKLSNSENNNLSVIDVLRLYEKENK